MTKKTHYNHLSCNMEPLEPTISAQVAKKSQIGPTQAISDYRKMPKRLVLIIGHRKHDSETRREAFKPMWLTLGDHDQRKTRQRAVCGYIEDLSYNIQQPQFLGQTGGLTFRTLLAIIVH